jgi:hypothetical protein
MSGVSVSNWTEVGANWRMNYSNRGKLCAGAAT